ncbi:MAG TPA: NADH-quinone oxidoreductase subunit N [Acidobacteriota bacterium]|nr:NADH-quinone oxidoreductase subunit N [Acidobacteriota bacterium]
MSETVQVPNLLEFLQSNAAAIGPQLQLIAWGLGILLADFLFPEYRIKGRIGVISFAFHGKQLAAVFSAVGIIMASIHLYVLRLAGVGPAFFDMVSLDSFSLFFGFLVLLAALVAVFISYNYLNVEKEQHSEYYALILFAAAGMMFMASAIDLVTIFVGLELMSISIYVLVGFLRGQRRSNEAAMKYFLLGTFSTAMILYGMSLLYGLAGTTNLERIGAEIASQGTNSLVVVALLMLMAGLCFKIAAAPFHMWAPDAYEGAPTAVTAFMSVAVKAAAFAIFLRIFIVVFAQVRELYVPVLAVISMVTMTWGNIAALTQQNVKRMLAYSSISHAGFVLMGLVAGTENGVTASLIYLLAYTFMNLGVWTVIVLLRREDIPGEQVDDLGGLFFKRPGVAVLMLVFLLSLAGIPPLAGFIAKYYVFAATIQIALIPQEQFAKLMAWLAVVGALNAVISLYYYFRIVVAMFMRKEFLPAPLEFSWGIAVSLAVTAIFTVLVGIWPQPFIDLARLASMPLV